MSHIPVLLHEALDALCIGAMGSISIAHLVAEATPALFWLRLMKVVD